MAKRLYLSRSDRKIAGVCGGLAEYFDIDATLLRLAWLFVVIATGIFPGVIAYLAAWLVVPKAPAEGEVEEVEIHVKEEEGTEGMF